jgi:hypothetical protein
MISSFIDNQLTCLQKENLPGFPEVENGESISHPAFPMNISSSIYPEAEVLPKFPDLGGLTEFFL